MSLKKLFLAGIEKIFSPKVKPLPKKNVARALCSDWLKIAADFQKVMSRYGK